MRRALSISEANFGRPRSICTIVSVVTVYKKTGLSPLIADTLQDLDVASCTIICFPEPTREVWLQIKEKL